MADTLTHHPENQSENNIILLVKQKEMLRITPEGFYVRGVKLDQDETEARKVFDAIRQWLDDSAAGVINSNVVAKIRGYVDSHAVEATGEARTAFEDLDHILRELNR